MVINCQKSRQLEALVRNLSVSKARRATRNGREHVVVPMTMIVPGVLNGSKGALLYPPEEVGKNASAWNGIPITVHHPRRNGRNVSARDPSILDSQGVGVVLQARTGKKLTAEAWIDVEKANRVDRRIVENIDRGMQLEISTGLYTDNFPAPDGATYNGQPYQFVARNYRPDHLAILPDQIGACSVRDGCGLGVNSSHEFVLNCEYLANELKGKKMIFNRFEGEDDCLDMVSRPMESIIRERRAELNERQTDRSSMPSPRPADDEDVADMAPQRTNWKEIARLP